MYLATLYKEAGSNDSSAREPVTVIKTAGARSSVEVIRGSNEMEYTLYHLLGHLLADDSTPDADEDAEAISSWLMIKHWPAGGEQWFANVQAFARASQLLDGPLSDYWHSHALYKSRQKTLQCWILGSDPD